MRMVIAFVLLFLVAPAAHATEGATERARESERVRPNVTQSVAEEPELRLDRVRTEDRAPSEDAAAQDMPRRGSFWWIVGAIVVAGVILAVIL